MADDENYLFDVWALGRQMQKIMANHAQLLLEQYRTLQGLYGGPNISLGAGDMWPKGSEQAREAFEKWARAQMGSFTDTLRDSLKEYIEDAHDLEVSAPSVNRYLEMLREHTRLWIENYEKLRIRRDKAYMESFETLKASVPEQFRPYIDKAHQWLITQYEMMEEQLLQRLKSQGPAK